jgi:gas vesicle protein
MAEAENGGGGSKFAYFLTGLCFGVVIALLFAPRSGEEMRDLLGTKAGQSKDYVSTRGKEFRTQAEQLVGKAKDLVSQQKEQLSAALEAGKQAYQEEKTKTQ